MKFTIAASYLVVLTAAFAVLSIEATSLRGKESLSRSDLSTYALQLNAPLTGVRRRLEENANDDENEAQDEDNENDDAGQENDDAGQENDDAADENNAGDDAAQGENDDASDDYTFYDDLALQDCEDGDEDCEMAATYADYDDEYLANCEEDDEDCNDAAAYMIAKQKQEDEVATNPWDVKTYTDKYDSMSDNSKIWIIALAVWFTVLGLATCYLCCCRKGYASQRPSRKKSLRQSLMGAGRRKSSSSYDEDDSADEGQRGRSKFRIFGRKDKKRRSQSRNLGSDY